MRGTAPRRYRNTLAFLAADRTRLDELEQAVREYLAWHSIADERDTLNLDAFQTKQTQTKRQDADETIRQRIPETYQWLLVPEQTATDAPLTWREIRLQGEGALAVRAAREAGERGPLAYRIRALAAAPRTRPGAPVAWGSRQSATTGRRLCTISVSTTPAKSHTARPGQPRQD